MNCGLPRLALIMADSLQAETERRAASNSLQFSKFRLGTANSIIQLFQGHRSLGGKRQVCEILRD